MDKRYEQLKARLCPGCPLLTTCPQFAEQLDACNDADLIQKEELPDALGRAWMDRMRSKLRGER